MSNVYYRVYRCALTLALSISLTTAAVATGSGGEPNFTKSDIRAASSHGSLRYAYAESLFLDFRHSDGDQPVAERLLVDDGSEVVLRADDASGSLVGPRITLGTIGSDHRGWEATYFGVFAGTRSASVSGDNDLAMIGDLALSSYDFFKSDRIAIESQTRLHSFELSRTWFENSWCFLMGFRYLRVQDDFRLLSFDSDTGDQGPDADDNEGIFGFGDYDVRTENDLFGLQSGLRHKRNFRIAPRLSYDFGGKAGVYGNSASHEQSVLDFGGTEAEYFLRDPFSDRSGQVAFVGEASANVRMPLTSRLEVRTGYNLLWVEGLALASDQLVLADVPVRGTTTSGGGLFHGASVGLVLHW